MEQEDYEENYEFCLTHSKEELEDLLDENNILGSEELESKSEMCDILARFVYFEVDDVEVEEESLYEQLPAEMIEKISGYLDLEGLQRLALTNKNISKYQNRYIKDELIKQKIVRLEIVRQQVLDFIQKSGLNALYNPTVLLSSSLKEDPNEPLDFLVELIREIKIINSDASIILWRFLVQYNRTDVIKYLLISSNDNVSAKDLKVLYSFYYVRYNNPEILNLIVTHPNFRG